MFNIKPLNEFIQSPSSVLEECLRGPVEISAREQSFVIMTKDYLQRLLADSSLADHLEKILSDLKNTEGIPENVVMSLLESK